MHRTVCRRVHDYEARVDQRLVLPLGELDRVGMAANAIIGLVHVDIVRAAVQRPQGRNPSAAAADDGDPLPGIRVSPVEHGNSGT